MDKIFKYPSLSFIALLVVVLALAGCQQVFSVVFDIPQQQKSSMNRVEETPILQVQTPIVADTVRPAIEETLVADSVIGMLPKDHAGNIDWMEAMRKGVIRPRDAIGGPRYGDSDESFTFGFDFHFEGPAPTFDAYFPHSAHTKWVNCQQCHGPIFKYRDTPIQMADILGGKFCGECHGKVSFPPVTGCERCHLDLEQPANRAQPLLLGTIRLTRVERTDSLAMAMKVDSLNASANTEEVLVSENALPPAVFPHWVHRIRFTCKTCHMELFTPKAGANAITMKDISAGNACGACHNGETAFDAGFGECQRCHAPMDGESL